MNLAGLKGKDVEKEDLIGTAIMETFRTLKRCIQNGFLGGTEIGLWMGN